MRAELSSFAEDVRKGLEAEFKYLPSKYFYDEEGSKLFQSIMGLEEYYPTRCEYEILSTHKNAICELLTQYDSPFELVELGAGDGFKTKILLECLTSRKVNFTYVPIDISPTILDTLTSSMRKSIPSLRTNAIAGDYFEVLSRLKRSSNTRRVLLFLGSTIGNFTETEAIGFLSELRKCMNDNDLLMIGVDLQKHPKIISDAYNDRAGITRAFNLNLLHRINRELDGNFDIGKFEHYPVYDPLSGEAKSYLISTVSQKVTIGKLGSSYSFTSGEPIYTEISKKYTLQKIEELARSSGFRIQKSLLDGRQYFVDSVWQPI